MSSKKSSFNKIIKNNCNHKDEFDKNKNRSYFYCYKCNNIILIDNDKIYCTYKSLMDDEDFNDEIELDPISVVRLMVKRQEEHTKNINDKFSSYYDNDKNENELVIIIMKKMIILKISNQLKKVSKAKNIMTLN